MEEVFYSGSEVQITSSVARFGETYYPLNNVGAVTVSSETRDGFLGCVMFVVFGVVWWMAISRVWSLIFFALAAVALMLKSETQHMLVIKTSSGNQQVFKSKNAEDFKKIHMALIQAIASKNGRGNERQWQTQ